MEITKSERKLFYHFGWDEAGINLSNFHSIFIGCIWQAFVYPEKYKPNYIQALKEATFFLDKQMRMTDEYNQATEFNIGS